jgi:hypothetical protein
MKEVLIMNGRKKGKGAKKRKVYRRNPGMAIDWKSISLAGVTALASVTVGKMVENVVAKQVVQRNFATPSTLDKTKFVPSALPKADGLKNLQFFGGKAVANLGIGIAAWYGADILGKQIGLSKENQKVVASATLTAAGLGLAQNLMEYFQRRNQTEAEVATIEFSSLQIPSATSGHDYLSGLTTSDFIQIEKKNATNDYLTSDFVQIEDNTSDYITTSDAQEALQVGSDSGEVVVSEGMEDYIVID